MAPLNFLSWEQDMEHVNKYQAVRGAAGGNRKGGDENESSQVFLVETFKMWQKTKKIPHSLPG